MTNWVIVRDSDTEYTIIKDGKGYNSIDASANISNTIHAVHWNGTSGDEEIRDPSTGNIVENRDITSFDDYTWADSLWQSAYDAHLASVKQAEYDVVIAEGGTAEEAQAAADAITSV